MALVNHAKKEINAKIVYFGPAGSGKSTALKYVYSRIKPSLRGELRSVPAGADNLLFFDFSPFETPLPNGYHLRLHVYTLTGMVTNPATWKMTLKGTDGVMIMVNPDAAYRAESKESISQLRDFLSGYGVGLHETPAVLQFNSFSENNLAGAASQIAETLDLGTNATCCSNAASGEGLVEALTMLSRQVLENVTAKEYPTEVEIAHVSLPQEACEIVSPQADVRAIAPDNEPFPEGRVKVKLLSNDIVSGEGTIRIPLKITQSDSSRTVVVTVNVAVE